MIAVSNPQTPTPRQPGQNPPTGTTFGQPLTPGNIPANTGTKAARPPRSGGMLVVVTLVVAVLALVVGLAGVVLSAMALGRSGEATDLAARANTRALPSPGNPSPVNPDPVDTGAPTATPTPDEGGSQTAGPGPSTSPADISPTAQFTNAYDGEHLRVRSVACMYSSNTYVDLDEPRIAGTEEPGTELGYGGCDPGKLSTSLSFAEVEGPTVTPKDCLEKIRTDPGRSPVAPKSGMTLCFVTNQNAAAAQGITQKLVFVTVESISVDNNVGVLNVRAKAWTVPQ
jgi:hypothetical protein